MRGKGTLATMMRLSRIFRAMPCKVYLCVSLVLAGCEATAPVAPVPAQSVSQLQPASKISVAVDIRPHSQWTPERIEKTREAARLFESVVNSEAFANALAQRTDLQLTGGMSGAQILRVIRAGVPLDALRRGEAAGAPRITLALAISPESGEFSSYDGFTDLGTGVIYAQRAWFDRENVCRLAGLYAHEHMHVIGFTHANYYHPWRAKSVPYAIGYMVVDLARAQAGARCR